MPPTHERLMEVSSEMLTSMTGSVTISNCFARAATYLRNAAKKPQFEKVNMRWYHQEIANAIGWASRSAP